MVKIYEVTHEFSLRNARVMDRILKSNRISVISEREKMNMLTVIFMVFIAGAFFLISSCRNV